MKAFDLAEHARRMAEWRERNDNGDCGRVANDLIHYIEDELVPGIANISTTAFSGHATGFYKPGWRFNIEDFAEGALFELFDAMMAEVRKRKAGSLPSERAVEIYKELFKLPEWNARELLAEHQTLWDVLDERLGRG